MLAEKKNQDGKEEKSYGCSVQAGEDNVKEKPHNDQSEASILTTDQTKASILATDQSQASILNQPTVAQSDSSISIKLNFHDKIHSVSTYCKLDTFEQISTLRQLPYLLHHLYPFIGTQSCPSQNCYWVSKSVLIFLKSVKGLSEVSQKSFISLDFWLHTSRLEP